MSWYILEIDLVLLCWEFLALFFLDCVFCLTIFKWIYTSLMMYFGFFICGCSGRWVEVRQFVYCSVSRLLHVRWVIYLIICSWPFNFVVQLKLIFKLTYVFLLTKFIWRLLALTSIYVYTNFDNKVVPIILNILPLGYLRHERDGLNSWVRA